MSRIKGLAPFSANFEPQIASPLDARATVQYKSDLTLLTTWQANDGLVYTYKGMLVVVKDDTEENNGIYVLNNTNYTDINNWIKYSAGGTSGNRFKRVDVEAIPIRQQGMVNLGQLAFNRLIHKYMPLYSLYIQLFLFEIYQEGTGILGSDLVFTDDVELKDYLDFNADFNNSVIIRCYYYEDTEVTSMLPIKGTNFAYSIVHGSGHHNAKVKTMGDSYNTNLWGNKEAFVNDLFQYAFGTAPVTPSVAAGAIYFARNRDKLYSHHRDDYATLIDETESPNKLMFNNAVTSFIANGGVNFVITGSFYVQFSRNGAGPAVYSIGTPVNNARKHSLLVDNESIIKVYKLKDRVSGYNAFMIKPAGMDVFYCGGISAITPINVVGIATGAINKQHKFSILTAGMLNDTGSNTVAVVEKQSNRLIRLFGTVRQINNPSKNNISDVEIMFNYGNGYFSKRSNPIKLVLNSRGINSQLLV